MVILYSWARKGTMLYHVPDVCMAFARQVDGETRVGVFTSHSIKVGELLTYDFRYSTQLFYFIPLIRGHTFLIGRRLICMYYTFCLVKLNSPNLSKVFYRVSGKVVIALLRCTNKPFHKFRRF
jgi:hypothetical protein